MNFPPIPDASTHTTGIAPRGAVFYDIGLSAYGKTVNHPVPSCTRAPAPDRAGRMVVNGTSYVTSNASRRPRLSHYLEYAGLRLGSFIVRALPLSVATAICANGVRLIAPLTARHRRALAHLEFAMPELSEAERERIARGMWANIGTVVAETLWFDRLARDESRFSFDFNGTDDVISNAPDGCVFVSCHFANWEVLSVAGMMLGRKVAGVYQKLANPLSDAFLKAYREPCFTGGLFPKSHSTGRRLLAIAKKGGDISVLADLRDLRGIQVPFFGHLAWSTPFPAMIARTYDRPLIALRPVRTGSSRFRFEFRIIDVPRTDDRAADVAEATGNIQACFENWIREAPDQWLWTHRKWAPRGWKKGPRSRFAGEINNAT